MMPSSWSVYPCWNHASDVPLCSIIIYDLTTYQRRIQSVGAARMDMNGFIIMFVDCQQIRWEPQFVSASAGSTKRKDEEIKENLEVFLPLLPSIRKYRRKLLWILKKIVRNCSKMEGKQFSQRLIPTDEADSSRCHLGRKWRFSRSRNGKEARNRRLRNKQNYNDGIHFYFPFVWVASEPWVEGMVHSSAAWVIGHVGDSRNGDRKVWQSRVFSLFRWHSRVEHWAWYAIQGYVELHDEIIDYTQQNARLEISLNLWVAIQFQIGDYILMKCKDVCFQFVKWLVIKFIRRSNSSSSVIKLIANRL